MGPCQLLICQPFRNQRYGGPRAAVLVQRLFFCVLFNSWSSSRLHRITCPPADNRSANLQNAVGLAAALACASELEVAPISESTKHCNVAETRPQQDNRPAVKSELTLASPQACGNEGIHRGREQDEV